MKTEINIEKDEANLRAAREILAAHLRVKGAIVPHNPCVMYEPNSRFGTLRLRSKLMPPNDGDIELLDDLDSLGDGWALKDAAMFIDWLNENCP